MDKQSILYSFFKIELYFQYTADDCFELGRQCCKNEDYHHAVPLLEESLVKYQAEINKTITLEEILDHLLFASNQLQGINKLLLHLYEMLFIFLIWLTKGDVNLPKYYRDKISDEPGFSIENVTSMKKFHEQLCRFLIF